MFNDLLLFKKGALLPLLIMKCYQNYSRLIWRQMQVWNGLGLTLKASAAALPLLRWWLPTMQTAPAALDWLYRGKREMRMV